MDVDATLVTSHSDKQHPRPTFKRGSTATICSGRSLTTAPLAALLRPGNAGSSTAADHITVLRDALPAPDHKPGSRPGRKVLVRVDGAGVTDALLDWLTGQRLSYSVGFTLLGKTAELLTLIPDDVWQVALDSDGEVGTARGSPNSPACSTSRAGPRTCASSRHLLLVGNVQVLS